MKRVIDLGGSEPLCVIGQHLRCGQILRVEVAFPFGVLKSGRTDPRVHVRCGFGGNNNNDAAGLSKSVYNRVRAFRKRRLTSIAIPESAWRVGDRPLPDAVGSDGPVHLNDRAHPDIYGYCGLTTYCGLFRLKTGIY